MVDVHDLGVRGDAVDAASRPLDVAGVEEEHQARIGVTRRPFQDLVEAGQPCVHRRQGVRDHDPDGLAVRAERFGEGKAAAQGVAVGVLVSENQDLAVAVDESFELVERAYV